MGDRSFQAGKGSADRSPGWRSQYDTIAWPDGGKRGYAVGFTKIGGKLVKRYGVPQPATHDTAPAIVIH